MICTARHRSTRGLVRAAAPEQPAVESFILAGVDDLGIESHTRIVKLTKDAQAQCEKRAGKQQQAHRPFRPCASPDLGALVFRRMIC